MKTLKTKSIGTVEVYKDDYVTLQETREILAAKLIMVGESINLFRKEFDINSEDKWNELKKLVESAKDIEYEIREILKS